MASEAPYNDGETKNKGKGFEDIGAAQAKDIKNSYSLKEAAKNGALIANKTEKEDFKIKFSLADPNGIAKPGVDYKIRTTDGKIYEGKTNNNGETENLSGYTAADCVVVY